MGHSDTHRRLHALFNERRLAAIEEHLAPEFMYEDLARGLTLKTPHEFTDYLQGWITAFSDAEPGSPVYYDGADHSLALFHARGVNDGPMLPGLDPTGQRMDLPLCEVLHYGSDGRALSGELYYDALSLFGQLGIDPAAVDTAMRQAAAPAQAAAAETAGGPEATVREMFERFDAMDMDAVQDLMTDDVRGIDEISRRWLRGRDGVREYFDQIQGVVTDIRSEMREVIETVYGDTAIVTCWLEQDYRLEGEPVHVSSPVTMVLRRVEDRWLIALAHAVPMPDEPAA